MTVGALIHVVYDKTTNLRLAPGVSFFVSFFFLSLLERRFEFGERRRRRRTGMRGAKV